jgi:hypothetical protein
MIMTQFYITIATNCQALSVLRAKLCSRSRRSELPSVRVYHLLSMSIYSILMWICEVWYTLLSGCVRLTICTIYWWEIALKFDLHLSFDNIGMGKVRVEKKKESW